MLNHRTSQGMHSEMQRRRREALERDQLIDQVRAQREERDVGLRAAIARGLSRAAAVLDKRRNRLAIEAAQPQESGLPMAAPDRP